LARESEGREEEGEEMSKRTTSALESIASSLSSISFLLLIIAIQNCGPEDVKVSIRDVREALKGEI
jgi:hypothetical protein